jgi:polyhydroxyalkanoate synthesis regulator phasin
MPQPKKPASSGRKPAARKPAARKAAASRSGGRSAAGQGTRGKPGAAKVGAAKASAGAAAGGARSGGDDKREDQLMAAIASLRDVLSKGVVITGERLQETVDEAVRRGRMTRQDAEELVGNLVEIGRRQAQDALAEAESLLGRSATQTRRITRSRVKSVGSAARRAPGTDRALRTVDRVRRAAGLGQSFPITGYEDLTTAQVKERLGDLDDADLRKVRDHEKRNANRKSVLAAIEKRLS